MSNIGPEAPDEKSFVILNIFPIQMHREANLTLLLKGQCQCSPIILTILVDLPSPIRTKIQPQGILGSGEDF